ncbi:MAG TPA: SusD/RagB family nutrient-binding outer membrane lipoprotein [Cyclobacteriaceae bacterium]|jgi:hypothetical protein|nr:SusD/RagB family nutrient-binding outer membrane lipoprotein [Cyclobacteriaceae bacterium]
MKRKIIYSLMAVTLIVFSACKSYLDINTNPNQLSQTNPDFVLSGALVTTVQNTVSFINLYTSQWGGYLAASGGYSPSGDYVRYYNNPATFGNGTWNSIYSNLSNYAYVEKNSSANQNYVAVCEIMKAYGFQQLVDIFGDVPYSQSLTGFSYLYPLYDNQQTVYHKIANKLDSAVLLIKNTGNAPVSATADVMFKGDMTKWAKLANTLHLRLLIRQSEVADNAYIASEIAKISSNGMGFLGAGEDATINPGYQKASGLQNPTWNNYGASYTGTPSDYLRCSAFGVKMLKNLSDPRLDYICLTIGIDDFGKPGVLGSGPYVGIDFGSPAAVATNSNNTSALGPGIVVSPTQNQVFISAAQSMFLQAEAVLRGWMPGDPKALYNAAITESFRILGVASSKPASSYYNGTALWPASDFQSNLQALITQKWIANYGVDCLEAWSDFRRLGIPSVPKSVDPSITSSTPYPARLLYPQSEFNNNPNSVQKAIDANGGDFTVFAPRIFWDPN